MPDIRLLALDIDGTLVNSAQELTDATRNAVRTAREAGIEVVLATGRRYSRALPLVEPLGLSVPVVTASGALIKDPADHATLFCAEFAPGVLPAALRQIDAAGYEAVLYADTFLAGFDYYCPRRPSPQPELDEFLEYNAGCERLDADLMRQPPPGVFALFAMGSREEMRALDARLRDVLGEELMTHVLRSPRYQGFMCEIAPRAITKWSGVLRLAGQWGIPPAEICAVGDDVNDIPMIRASGLGVAMGNSADDVKAAADLVAPSHDDDGLVEVIRWLLE